jgi:hypothetical protein
MVWMELMIDPLLHLEVIGQGTPVEGKGCFLLQRNAHVIAVQLEGEIVDEVSEGWRAMCQQSFDELGYPPFGYVDATGARVAQSLGVRMRSAAFMRKSAERMTRVALVSADAHVGFVIRAIMRAAGVGNVQLVDAQAGAAALADMREGRDPFAV